MVAHFLSLTAMGFIPARSSIRAGLRAEINSAPTGNRAPNLKPIDLSSRSALEKFSSVLQFDGGDLEDKYDQVLFLKHDLNARAIASLRTELVSVETEVNSLIKDMNASIKEADAFIGTMMKE